MPRESEADIDENYTLKEFVYLEGNKEEGGRRKEQLPQHKTLRIWCR